VKLLEVVLAPLYFHALFFNRPADTDHARTLVDRLLTLANLGEPRRAHRPPEPVVPRWCAGRAGSHP
jgi:hypothetical protein